MIKIPSAQRVTIFDMQDPKRREGPREGPQARPHNSASTLDETDLDSITDSKTLIQRLLQTAREKVMEMGGFIELTESEEGSTTVFHFGDREVRLTIESNRDETRQRIEFTTLKEPAMGPYQTSYHERGVDSKQRTFWPAGWKKAIPTIAICDPNGPDLKIIFTSDPKTDIPAGWLVATKTNGLLRFEETGRAGQMRLSLRKLFGRNRKIEWPEKVDLNGHGSFATMVKSGSSDSLPLSLS